MLAQREGTCAKVWRDCQRVSLTLAASRRMQLRLERRILLGSLQLLCTILWVLWWLTGSGGDTQMIGRWLWWTKSKTRRRNWWLAWLAWLAALRLHLELNDERTQLIHILDILISRLSSISGKEKTRECQSNQTQMLKKLLGRSAESLTNQKCTQASHAQTKMLRRR